MFFLIGDGVSVNVVVNFLFYWIYFTVIRYCKKDQWLYNILWSGGQSAGRSGPNGYPYKFPDVKSTLKIIIQQTRDSPTTDVFTAKSQLLTERINCTNFERELWSVGSSNIFTLRIDALLYRYNRSSNIFTLHIDALLYRYNRTFNPMKQVLKDYFYFIQQIET